MLRPLAVSDVTAAVGWLPDKQCSNDPLTVRLLKGNIIILAPFITELFNRSRSFGSVSAKFKAAYIRPLLKKAKLDPMDDQPIFSLTDVKATRTGCGQTADQLSG
jgi:hypothetical protein